MSCIKSDMFKDNPELCVEWAEEWTLAQDVALLKKLEDVSERLISKTETVLQDLDTFGSDITDAHLQMKNLTHKFLLLADQQFIEHRVNEEDELSETKVTDRDNSTVQNESSQALIHCLSSMESAFKLLNDEDIINEPDLTQPPPVTPPPIPNVSSPNMDEINNSEDDLSVSSKSEVNEKDNPAPLPVSHNIYSDPHDDLMSELVRKKNIFGASSSDSEQSTTSDHPPQSDYLEKNEEQPEVPITEQLNQLLKARFSEKSHNPPAVSNSGAESKPEPEIESTYEKSPQNGLPDENISHSKYKSRPQVPRVQKPDIIPKKHRSLFASDSSDEEPPTIKPKTLFPKKVFVSDLSDDEFPFLSKSNSPAASTKSERTSNGPSNKIITSENKVSLNSSEEKSEIKRPETVLPSKVGKSILNKPSLLDDGDDDSLFLPDSKSSENSSFPAKVKLLSANLKFPVGNQKPPSRGFISPLVSPAIDDPFDNVKPASSEEDLFKSSSLFTDQSEHLSHRKEHSSKMKASLSPKKNGNSPSPEHAKKIQKLDTTPPVNDLLIASETPVDTNAVDIDQLPTFNTEVLTSANKTRVRMKVPRRLPSRFNHSSKSPRDSGTTAEITKEKNEPPQLLPPSSVPSPGDVSWFSPTTDEEDLFLVPDVKLPRDSSSFNLFNDSLLSPGTTIGENLPYSNDANLFKTDESKPRNDQVNNSIPEKINSYLDELFEDNEIDIVNAGERKQTAVVTGNKAEQPKAIPKVPVSLFDDSDEDISLFSGSNLALSSASKAVNSQVGKPLSVNKTLSSNKTEPNVFYDLFSDDSDSLFSEPSGERKKSRLKKTS